VLSEILAHGGVRRRQLGIVAQISRLPRTLVREHDLLADYGVEVRDVVPKSVAARAGVLPGDIIVALAGRLVTSIDDLHRLLMTLPTHQEIELSLVRGNRLQTLVVPAGNA
jgi:serine protease DegQ